MTTVENRDASRIDWRFWRGDTWSFDFTFAYSYTTTGGEAATGTIDLTGSTWSMQIREGDSTGAVWQTPTIDSSAQADGLVIAKVEETATSGADTGTAVYWYDLQQTLDDDVATPVWGKITVTADVTRSS